jgi:hypothetical protein
MVRSILVQICSLFCPKRFDGCPVQGLEIVKMHDDCGIYLERKLHRNLLIGTWTVESVILASDPCLKRWRYNTDPSYATTRIGAIDL